jgi:hypothetical protein
VVPPSLGRKTAFGSKGASNFHSQRSAPAANHPRGMVASGSSMTLTDNCDLLLPR